MLYESFSTPLILSDLFVLCLLSSLPVAKRRCILIIQYCCFFYITSIPIALVIILLPGVPTENEDSVLMKIVTYELIPLYDALYESYIES